MPSLWPIPRIRLPQRSAANPPEPIATANGTRPETHTDPNAELVRVLEAVTAMCDRIIDAMEVDRAERTAVVAALSRLADVVDARRADSRPAVEVTERILGGTIGPTTSEVEPPRNDTAPTAVEPEPEAVEVRSGLEDRWVDGFEVCETVSDDQGIRYRIRRLVDRVVLPDLFTENDVRRRTGRDAEPAAPRVRRWSPF